MKWVTEILFVAVFSLWPGVIWGQQSLTGLVRSSDQDKKYEKKLDQIKKRVGGLELELDKLNQRLGTITRQQVRLSSETLSRQDRFDQQLANLNSRVETIGKDITGLTDSLARSETQLAKLASELPELKSTISDLSGRIFQLQSELGTIREKTGLVHGKIESADDTIVVLREEQVKLDQDISRCKKEIARLKGQGVSLPRRVFRSPWIGITAFGLALIALVIALV